MRSSRHARSVEWIAGIVAVVAVVGAGCGGQQSAAPAATPAPATTGAPTSAPAASSAAPPPSAPANPAPAVTPAAPATATASEPPLPAPQVVASQPYNNNPDVRCDVMEVRRVSGGALLIRWRVIRPAAQAAAGLAAGQQQPGIYVNWAWENVYFTDPAENKKYQGLRDSAGAWLGQGDSKAYSPGDQQMMWMKFPAPPPASNKITFVFPGFPPFEDLPVS